MLFSAKLAIQAILFELFNRDKFLINTKCPRLSSSTYKRFTCLFFFQSTSRIGTILLQTLMEMSFKVSNFLI